MRRSPGDRGRGGGEPIAVRPKAPYTLETFVDASALTAGTVGFYIDEWNEAGTWISGQYVKDVPTERDRRVEHVAFSYVAGSGVTRASVQIILSPGAKGQARVDGVSWLDGRHAY